MKWRERPEFESTIKARARLAAMFRRRSQRPAIVDFFRNCATRESTIRACRM